MWRRPTQAVQPWQFWHLAEPGKGEVKETCFWLDGLDPLVPTTPDEPGRHPACWLQRPSPDRWKLRSRTYDGIADAMAVQWAGERQAKPLGPPLPANEQSVGPSVASGETR
jgi:hypothetical protein